MTVGTRLAALAVVCALAACEVPVRRRVATPPTAPTDTWIVAREPAVARRVTAPSTPAVAGPAGPLGLARTRIAVTVVGPIVSVHRTTTYVAAEGARDLAVAFTPPASPERHDYVVRVGGRTLTFLVRGPREAQTLARATPGASLIGTDAAGAVRVPLGATALRTIELRHESTGLVPWHDGAYELTVPREPGPDVALAAEVHGPGPIVVMSSPSHAIAARPVSLEHMRVALRDPRTLGDADFVLRYRVDPVDRPGAFFVQPDGAGHLVGLVVHPLEASHEPVTATDVAIDWNGAPVTDVRPATIGTLPAGTPLVVLAWSAGDVRDPITLRARVGRETRTVTLARDDAVPAAGLASLWARTARPPVLAHR